MNVLNVRNCLFMSKMNRTYTNKVEKEFYWYFEQM